MQLSFESTYRLPGGVRTEVDFAGGDARLEVTLGPAGAQVVARAPRLGAVLRFQVLVDGGIRVSTLVEGIAERPTTWVLRAGARAALPFDVLGAAAKLLQAGLRPASGDAAREAFGAGLGQLRGVGRHLVRLLSPVPRRLALSFEPRSRLRVFGLLAADESGRMAQLAQVCPGLVVFVLALEDAGCTEVAREVVDGVRAGRRLGCLLDQAVEAWGPCVVPEQRPRQRQLVRRAGPRVPPALLWEAPPVVFASEDIPAHPALNRRWFRVAKAVPEVLLPAPPPPIEALSGFLSRRALELPLDEVERLTRFVLSTGRLLSRRTGWAALLRELERWPDPEADPGRALPVLADGYEGQGVRVWPLRTVGEVVEEGERMGHCVVQLLSDLARRRATVFHAEVSGKALTVEVRRTNGGLALTQARGVKNRGPTPEELAALRPWLETIGCPPVPSRWFERLPEGRCPAREVMERALEVLDQYAHAPPELPARPLPMPDGVDAEWAEDVCRRVLRDGQALVVRSPMGGSIPLLVRLLVSVVGGAHYRMTKAQENRLADHAAALYGSSLWFEEVPELGEVEVRRVRGERRAAAQGEAG